MVVSPNDWRFPSLLFLPYRKSPEINLNHVRLWDGKECSKSLKILNLKQKIKVSVSKRNLFINREKKSSWILLGSIQESKC